jgi:hypothetical protein
MEAKQYLSVKNKCNLMMRTIDHLLWQLQMFVSFQKNKTNSNQMYEMIIVDTLVIDICIIVIVDILVNGDQFD